MGEEGTFFNRKKTALRVIREKGPIIPSQLYKEIDTDILMASALLSELVSDGGIRVSNIKFGGSPFYYMEGQEQGLENHIDRLHEKEKKTLMILKQKKVLLDSNLDSVTRIALRNSKDFAKPFEAKIGERKELFWRWFLFPKEEVKERVIFLLKENNSRKKEIKEEKQRTPSPPTKINKTSKQKEQKKDDFLCFIRKMFETEKISCLNESILRANKELDFVIGVPSALGEISYYCRALDKKKCTDKDLSSAFVQGQIKKLPVLFLTTGELTKKAEKMKNKEFTGMVFKKLV